MNRVLIVDDENAARRKVVRYLKECDPSALVEQASNGKEAVEKLATKEYDVVFLDIQMPDMTGFEVIQTIGVESMPRIVFGTAFDEYALSAFEAGAVDYLLKPFDLKRFKKAYERVIAMGHAGDSGLGDLKELLDQISSAKPSGVERLIVRDAGRIHFIETKDIVSITADGHYACIQTPTKKFLDRKSLKELEGQLNPDVFKRIHKSAIVNCDCIKELQPLTHGDYAVILNDGSRSTLSRRYVKGMGLD